jgi:hypothetical protein
VISANDVEAQETKFFLQEITLTISLFITFIKSKRIKAAVLSSSKFRILAQSQSCEAEPIFQTQDQIGELRVDAGSTCYIATRQEEVKDQVASGPQYSRVVRRRGFIYGCFSALLCLCEQKQKPMMIEEQADIYSV